MPRPDNTLIYKVAQTARQKRLFLPGDTLVVGLTGGADSSALLDLLCRLPDYNLTLVAAHLNHSLRGVESDADEEFCRILAEKSGIPFEIRRVDIKALAEGEGMNLEDAGRCARIKFLDEVRQKYAATAVALAHHADDQAETLLMRLMRGSGMTGLSAMAFRNARGYIRPLLEITRSEIERYLKLRGLAWREDSSNSDTKYLRNRIRHELLPLLETYNPAIRSTLAGTAALLSGDEAFLEELAEQAFMELCLVGERKIVCSIGRMGLLNPALRRRVIRIAFRQLAGGLEGVSLRHIEAVCGIMISPRPNLRLNLPQGVAVVREYDDLIFIPGLKNDGETDFELLVTEPGSWSLPCGGSLSVVPASLAALLADANSVCLDLTKFPFPWLVRTCRPGDRMTPFGMRGTKKVKDIFIDRKIPLSERRRIPLLFCSEHLIWVAGVCVSEWTRIDTASASAVRVTWR